MNIRLLSGILLLGLAGICASSAELPPREYRISGVAVSSRDGSPIPYCRISANAVLTSETVIASPPTGPRRPAGGPANQTPDRSGAPAAPLQVTADSSGRFALQVPRAGAWRLTATARGYRSQNYDEHEGFFSEVVLTETAPAYSLTFRIHPDSVLSGLIFDEAGEPVASAQVTAILVPPTTPGISPAVSRDRPTGFGRTDDRGRYEISGLAPGTYRLRVQGQPWYATAGMGMQFNRTLPPTPSPDPSLDDVYPITWFPGTDDEATADTITLADGEERQADFHLVATPAVHLRIPRTDPVNPPAPGEQRRQPVRPAMVTRVGGDNAGGFVTMNGSAPGEWDFGGLSPGIYEIRIPSPDGKSNDIRQLEVHSGSQGVLTLEAAKPLVRVQLKLEGVEKSEAANVEFIDTGTGTRIASSSPRGRGGFQRGDQSDDAPLADAESAGRTVMLPPHEFSVQINGNAGAYLTGISAEGAKVAGRLVTVSGPATLMLHLADQRVNLDGIARIAGAPAAGAMALLVPATFGTPGDLTSIVRDETNTDGSFRFSAVRAAQYILLVIDHGWNVDWRDPATLGQYLLHGKPIDLRSTAKAHEEIEAVRPQ